MLILQILTLLALAACPALHHALHPDSDRADHDCAVTIFAHGNMESSVVEVVVTLPVAIVHADPVFSVCLVHEAVAVLPPGRAPPVALLPS